LLNAVPDLKRFLDLNNPQTRKECEQKSLNSLRKSKEGLEKISELSLKTTNYLASRSEPISKNFLLDHLSSKRKLLILFTGYVETNITVIETFAKEGEGYLGCKSNIKFTKEAINFGADKTAKEEEAKTKDVIKAQEIKELAAIGFSRIFQPNKIKEIPAEIVVAADAQIVSGISLYLTVLAFPPCAPAVCPLASTALTEGISDLVLGLINYSFKENDQPFDKSEFAKQKGISVGISLGVSIISAGIGGYFQIAGNLKKGISAAQTLSQMGEKFLEKFVVNLSKSIITSFVMSELVIPLMGKMLEGIKGSLIENITKAIKKDEELCNSLIKASEQNIAEKLANTLKGDELTKILKPIISACVSGVGGGFGWQGKLVAKGIDTIYNSVEIATYINKFCATMRDKLNNCDDKKENDLKIIIPNLSIQVAAQMHQVISGFIVNTVQSAVDIYREKLQADKEAKKQKEQQLDEEKIRSQQEKTSSENKTNHKAFPTDTANYTPESKPVPGDGAIIKTASDTVSSKKEEVVDGGSIDHAELKKTSESRNVVDEALRDQQKNDPYVMARGKTWAETLKENPRQLNQADIANIAQDQKRHIVTVGPGGGVLTEFGKEYSDKGTITIPFETEGPGKGHYGGDKVVPLKNDCIPVAIGEATNQSPAEVRDKAEKGQHISHDHPIGDQYDPNRMQKVDEGFTPAGKACATEAQDAYLPGGTRDRQHEVNNSMNSHQQLTEAGYTLIGYHGTTSEGYRQLVKNAADIKTSKFPDKKKHWDGFYVAEGIAHAEQYTGEYDPRSGKHTGNGPVLAVYAPTDAYNGTKKFTDSNNINSLAPKLQQANKVTRNRPGHNAAIINGPVEQGGVGETVIQANAFNSLQDIVFLPVENPTLQGTQLNQSAQKISGINSYFSQYTLAMIKKILELRTNNANLKNLQILKRTYIFQERYTNLQEILIDLLHTKSTRILTPINLYNKHAVGLMFIKQESNNLRAFYIDSSNEVIPSELAQIFTNKGIKIEQLSAEQQKYANCGPEVIENFMLYLTGERLSQEDAIPFHSKLVEQKLMGVLPYHSQEKIAEYEYIKEDGKSSHTPNFEVLSNEALSNKEYNDSAIQQQIGSLELDSRSAPTIFYANNEIVPYIESQDQDITTNMMGLNSSLIEFNEEFLEA
jgi:hypothetical protein